MLLSPFVAVAIGAIMISLAPIFTAVSDLGPTLTAFYRCFLAGVIILAWKRRLPNFKQGGIKLQLPGLLFAIDLFLWHRSIQWAGPGLSTVLANTQILFVMFIAHWFLGEVLPFKQWFYSAVAMLGIVLISFSAWNQGSVNLTFFFGVILGVSAGLAYAFYLISFRSLRPKSWQEAIHNLGWVSLSAGIFLGVLLFLEGTTWKVPRGFAEWWPILGLVLICQILGWIFISWGAAKMPATKVSILLLLQPVLATAFSFSWLGERWNHWQTIGATMTVGAIYLCLKTRGAEEPIVKPKQGRTLD